MDLLERLLEHDAWTTSRFLEIARELSDQQLDHDCGIGHRTVRTTFDHVIWNVECWTDLMLGRTVRDRPTGLQSIGDLDRRFNGASEEFRRCARDVVDQGRLSEQFRDTLDDPPRLKSKGTTIIHVATHGMHHRAQLLIMFRQFGIAALPEGDALSWEAAINLVERSEPEDGTEPPV